MAESKNGIGENKMPISAIYIASNISTEKMLDALNYMRERAHGEHRIKVEVEQKRYEQELKDIEHFRDMFYCSNYEK